MRFSVLGFRSEKRIELQAPVAKLRISITWQTPDYHVDQVIFVRYHSSQNGRTATENVSSSCACPWSHYSEITFLVFKIISLAIKRTSKLFAHFNAFFNFKVTHIIRPFSDNASLSICVIILTNCLQYTFYFANGLVSACEKAYFKDICY